MNDPYLILLNSFLLYQANILLYKYLLFHFIKIPNKIFVHLLFSHIYQYYFYLNFINNKAFSIALSILFIKFLCLISMASSIFMFILVLIIILFLLMYHQILVFLVSIILFTLILIIVIFKFYHLYFFLRIFLFTYFYNK